MSAQPAPSLQPISKARAWILATRPKTLPAAFAPVLVGTALAHEEGQFTWLPAVAALLGAVLLQIGSNLANDYFDYVKGADTVERVGPIRVTAAGLLAPDSVRLGMILVFCAAAGIGVYLIVVAGWPILLIGIASIAAAIAYTGGPLPFGYIGLGDIFVFLFFGVVAVGGAYFVQTLTISWTAIIAAAPVGALITAILVVNNLRDIDTDRAAGKYTLAVYLGRGGAQMEYGLLLAIAYLAPLTLWQWPARQFSSWILLPWLTIPVAYRLAYFVFTTTSGQLNQVLAGTARLALFYSVLFSIGMLL